MEAGDVSATILAVVYFAAAIIGFQSKVLSETETKLLVAIGIIAAIVLSVLRREKER